MAKAASPIRLQQDLMQAAESTAKRFHRSTAEQIEYWAELGRSVSSSINPDVLLSIKTGLARLNVEQVLSPRIDPDAVFGAMELMRSDNSLQNEVTNCAVRYQSSLTHPGLLERVGRNGEVRIGQFTNGQFIVMAEGNS